MTSILNSHFKASVRLQETTETPEATTVTSQFPALLEDGKATTAGKTVCEQAMIIDEEGNGEEECNTVLGDTKGLCTLNEKFDPDCHFGIMMAYPHLGKIQETYDVDKAEAMNVLKTCVQCMMAGEEGHDTCDDTPIGETSCTSILKTILAPPKEEVEEDYEEEEAKVEE